MRLVFYCVRVGLNLIGFSNSRILNLLRFINSSIFNFLRVVFLIVQLQRDQQQCSFQHP
ncbi:hypothetical protein SP36_61 [Salmonella phage 36]|uniref:Uncharacterized protein n=1 Tax=Salmonella phage 36 TaxID=1654889 RepID=A0A0N7CDC8_9CAUD|nr:hypothetical protein SP36_61 [Salmonella phage 36]AKJ74033.1 hypothetical protein SP36_61 [Salmonella phage 36]